MWDYKIEEGGFGLIELMLSFALLTTLLMGILMLQGGLMQSKIVVERVDEAKNMAVQRLEDVLSQYSYDSITTANVNCPPLFTSIIKRDGIPYRPECTVTPLDDPFNGVGSFDYKEIKVTVTYPAVGVSFDKGVGTQTVVRYLYNTGAVVTP